MPWWGTLSKSTRGLFRRAEHEPQPRTSGLPVRLLDGSVLDTSDINFVVDLFRSVLPHRTKDEAIAKLSIHGWNLQSAVQHVNGDAGLEQGTFVPSTILACVVC